MKVRNVLPAIAAALLLSTAAVAQENNHSWENLTPEQQRVL